MVNESLRANHMVFFIEGSFHSMTVHPCMSIVGFSMRLRISVFAALPELHHGHSESWSRLLICRSAVLIVGITVLINGFKM